MARDGYLELDLYFEDRDEGSSVTLYLFTREREMLKFENVRHNPLRHKGQWTISHDFFGQQATSLVPADDVWYFTIIDNPSTEEGNQP